MDENITTRNFYDIIIRLTFLALIIGWCFMILVPFTSIILWALILTLALAPLHKTVATWMRGKQKLASFLIIFTCLVIILLPGWLFFDSIIEGVKSLRGHFAGGTLTIPPPSESVKSWPLIGTSVYNAWNDASVNLGATVMQYKDQLIGIGGRVAKGILSVGSGVFQMILSLIIAGFLLVIPGTGEAIRKFFRKVAGARGDEFADIANKTIGNVVKGILGVAFIQSFIIGVGFLLAGIPYAGLWTLIVFILAVLQIPTAIVVIPVIIYMFSVLSLWPAILWSALLLVGGLSDNILKPILLGKGAPVPMLVIFLGVLGGFILSGFIGLFTGAIVVSVGYKLLVGWMNDVNQ